ncbi:nuclear transport factor 2 family protein [Microbacterium aurugineum]
MEQRLQALEDRLEIIDLEDTYARTFDERDGDAWSSLFTADGIYQSRPVGDAPPQTFVQGRAALQAFCTDASFAGIHFLHLPQLAVAGDRASARIHLEFHGDYAEDAGAPRLGMRGFYDVIYHRVDGRWLIAHRVTTAFAASRTRCSTTPPPPRSRGPTGTGRRTGAKRRRGLGPRRSPRSTPSADPRS